MPVSVVKFLFGQFPNGIYMKFLLDVSIIPTKYRIHECILVIIDVSSLSGQFSSVRMRFVINGALVTI